MHERVHKTGKESRGKVRIEYDLPLRSLRLGLTGRADVVEFHDDGHGNWQPLPVEYKRGRPKKNPSDRVQLCAQALCLQEMLNTEVPKGALFYGKKRRRMEVIFESELIQQTETTASELHELISCSQTPAAHYSKRCDNCSFVQICLPKQLEKGKRVEKYMEQMLL